MVITIDGPSGVGKSSVTRAVASACGYEALDTGAMYRAATLAVLQAGVTPEDTDAAIDVIERSQIAYVDGTILLGGADVSAEVRGSEVTSAVSVVAAIPQVRRILVDLQRAWVSERDGEAVVEGRDIGTVVFPDAAVKIFLVARPEVRARRRAGDAEVSDLSTHAIEHSLRRRDHLDSTRKISPMLAAGGALTIDTSELSLSEVTEKVLAAVAVSVDPV